MRIREQHVVIGAGVAGCVTAILKHVAGYDVVIVERARSTSPDTLPLCTDTSSVVSENHSGAEYPYDSQSAMDCFDGRLDNEQFLPEFIYGGKVPSRIIASQSMIDANADILAQCRSNMDVLRAHYRRRLAENLRNYVFRSPAELCEEVDGVPGVNDVARAFITPQRGFNPVYVALALEHQLRELSIPVIENAAVTAVREHAGGYAVDLVRDGEAETLSASQVSISCGAHGLRLAKRLNPALQLPRIYLALREILFVDLPDGCDKNFTCLKLEHEYGGMLSPMSPNCAMVYHPPAAHIAVKVLNGAGEYPGQFTRFLRDGHPEQEERMSWTLDRLRAFYPELARSRVLKACLKVAINTTSDSRRRRNMGVFAVAPGCNLLILPKWTMCVSDAKKDLIASIAHSDRSKTISPRQAREALERVSRFRMTVPRSWYTVPAAFLSRGHHHCDNMGLPRDLTRGLAERHGYALSDDPVDAYHSAAVEQGVS